MKHKTRRLAAATAILTIGLVPAVASAYAGANPGNNIPEMGRMGMSQMEAMTGHMDSVDISMRHATMPGDMSAPMSAIMTRANGAAMIAIMNQTDQSATSWRAAEASATGHRSVPAADMAPRRSWQRHALSLVPR